MLWLFRCPQWTMCFDQARSRPVPVTEDALETRPRRRDRLFAHRRHMVAFCDFFRPQEQAPELPKT